MAFWRGRSKKGARADGDDGSVEDDPSDNVTIQDDLQPDAERAAEMAERFRARRARLEAERDLKRLRDRHWSGERLIEEGRIVEKEWWEHPEADPFAVLGLLPGAPLSEAAIARRRVAMECHPDRLPDGADPDLAMRRMVAANAAYDRLRRAMNPAQ